MTDYIFEDGGATLKGVVDKKIENAYIPNGVTKIADGAFRNCHCLEYVVFPQVLSVIGSRAFENCYSLKSVNFPASLTSIGGTAFMNCTSLETVDMPIGLKEIFPRAFSGCRSLEQIFLPDELTFLGFLAFERCTALRYVSLPESLTTIRRGTFGRCHSLSSIVIKSGVSVIENGAFAGCTSLQSVYLPDSLKEICRWAFYHCTSLNSVKLPSGKIKIASNAFDNNIIIETDNSNPMNIEELRAHNKAIEHSSEYLQIIPRVMNEVYSQFVNEEIDRSERYLEREEDDLFDTFYTSLRESTEEKLNEAKMLLPYHPEQAAQVFMQIGSCHRLWAIQKSILKEKYGITWYTPAELNPEIKYD